VTKLLIAAAAVVLVAAMLPHEHARAVGKTPSHHACQFCRLQQQLTSTPPAVSAVPHPSAPVAVLNARPDALWAPSPAAALAFSRAPPLLT